MGRYSLESARKVRGKCEEDKACSHTGEVLFPGRVLEITETLGYGWRSSCDFHEVFMHMAVRFALSGHLKHGDNQS